MNIVSKLFVVAAHPDDELLGCGGTIIKALERGTSVDILYLSSGEAFESTREKEARTVCEKLGVSKYSFLRLKGKNFTVESKNIQQVVNAFKMSKPDLIFAPHENDGDREHKIAYSLVSEAHWRYCEAIQNDSLPKAFMLYEVHTPLESYNLVEDISNQITAKMKVLALYKSQLKQNRIDLAIKGLNEYRGKMHENIEFAEVFKIKGLRSMLS
ncbi:MAG: PIG-L family deacetylase [bacterium]|nr:PIG-L family deacetylase [bacterium]